MYGETAGSGSEWGEVAGREGGGGERRREGGVRCSLVRRCCYTEGSATSPRVLISRLVERQRTVMRRSIGLGTQRRDPLPACPNLPNPHVPLRDQQKEKEKKKKKPRH